MNADITSQTDLILGPNIADCDDFYDELLRAHEPLSKTESDAFNARLVLILCNHIGERDIIKAALKAAKPAVDTTPVDEHSS